MSIIMKGVVSDVVVRVGTDRSNRGRASGQRLGWTRRSNNEACLRRQTMSGYVCERSGLWKIPDFSSIYVIAVNRIFHPAPQSVSNSNHGTQTIASSQNKKPNPDCPKKHGSFIHLKQNARINMFLLGGFTRLSRTQTTLGGINAGNPGPIVRV